MIQFGVCTAYTNAALLADTGIDFIEENIQRLLMPLAPANEFVATRTAVKAAPLPVIAANAFLPATLKCVGPDVDMATLLQYADTACGRAGELGITTLVLGSGGSRQIPEGWDVARAQQQFITLLQQFAPLAAKNGVTIVVEALNRGECNFLVALELSRGVLQRKSILCNCGEHYFLVGSYVFRSEIHCIPFLLHSK